MILRCFAESVQQQNWMAIAIEFVLLVTGVFLGFPALWDKYGAPDMCTKSANGDYACN